MSKRASLRHSIILNSINQTISEIKYKIVRKLGEGMFSTVKLATHSLTGEQVAIKILEKTKVSNLDDKERINRELAIMRKLNHYNIVKLYQIVETKLTIYLIQENIQGKELIDYLNKKGKLKEVEACKFFHQIISGLEYIHQCGVAHRDFKPENILLTNNNTILKIIDFGLGTLYKKNQLLKTACGSPCYIPPEMIKEESYNGAKSDIWSSGIILYLMLCGKLPFYHEQNDIMYKAILSGKFEIPSFLSENAKDILTKIIEIDPKKRLNFEEIKAHPWFNIIDKNELMHKGINMNEDIMPIDEEIISNMEKIGFNKMEVRYSLIKNFHNKVTTVYDLLLKKKIESGKKSIADMFSNLYDEYINDKKNKISFYGSLEKALKSRICDDNKVISVLPNYFEDKYDDDNEDLVIGDNGSVVERLIKLGRFTYDEENMCLNRVTNSNKPNNRKINSDGGDCKFKTLSSMSNNKKANNLEKKVKSSKESPKKAPDKISKTTISKKTNENINDFIDEDKKKGNEDEEDWYKEIEAMIDEEGKKKKEKKRKSQENIKNIIKENNYQTNNDMRASSIIRRKKKVEEIINNTVIDDSKIQLNRNALSNEDIKANPKPAKNILSKSTMEFNNHNNKKNKTIKFKNNSNLDIKRENTEKPSKVKTNNNKELKEDISLKTAKSTKVKFAKNTNLRSTMNIKVKDSNKDLIKTEKKTLRNSAKKINDLVEFFSPRSENIDNLKKSHKTSKFVKLTNINEKKSGTNGKFKKIEVEEDNGDDKLPNKNASQKGFKISSTKRINKIKI